MRQAVMTEPGVISFKEISKIPVPGKKEILLKIKRIGICGSDIHVYHGKHPFTSYPIVQGHEYSGVVVDTGNEVTKVKSGDKATGRPQLVCGTCNPCQKGDYNICQNLRVQGFQANGCAQDYFIIPEERLVKLPAELTFNEGAFIEPMAVGAHSTNMITDIENKNLVVFGAGTIGNIVAQFAKARGAAKILVSDPSDYRLEKIRESGINHINNPNNEEFKDAVVRVFGNDGFQAAIEAAGAEEPIMNSINHIEKGGEIIILGVFDKPACIHMSYICEHELKLKGSMMYKHEDYLEAVEYGSRKLIDTSSLITSEFSFEQYADAYRYIDESKDKTLKVMINMDL